MPEPILLPADVLVCAGCGVVSPRAMARIGQRLLCGRCWKNEGEPFPPASSIAEIRAAEERMRRDGVKGA